MLSFHEPPINELIGAGMMRVFGQESLGVLRGISLVEYLLAALVLYQLLRRLATPVGSLAGLALFLLCPFGISVSRSFLPDILMVLFAELTLLAALNHRAKRNLASMGLVALAAAAAIFVKLQAAPLLLPLLVWAVIQLRPRLSRMLWAAAVAAASMLPALAWLVATRIPQDTVFIPSLLFAPGFYTSWTLLLLTILGPGLLLVVLAVPLGRGADLVPLKLWGAGYLLYAVLLDYRVETHSYYSLFVVPLAALCTAVLISRLEYPARRFLLRLSVVNIPLLAVFALVGLWAPLAYVERPNHDAVVARYQNIGRLVGGGSTFILVGDGLGGGDSASYYTGNRVIDWPAEPDLALERLSGHAPIGAAERLSAATGAGGARWMVITNQGELRAQADLRAVLAGYRPSIRGGITVYDISPPTR
jgi:hypothetical protein